MTAARKVIGQQRTNTVSLTGGTSLSVNTGWVLQPVQGAQAIRQGPEAASAELAINPRVLFHVQLDSSAADLGLLQATWQLEEQGLDSSDSRYAEAEDFSGDLVETQGYLTFDLGAAPLSNGTLTLTYRGASTAVVLVRMTLQSDWTPQPAPADVQDAGGYGALGVVSNGDVGSVLPVRQAPHSTLRNDGWRNPDVDWNDPLTGGTLEG